MKEVKGMKKSVFALLRRDRSVFALLRRDRGEFFGLSAPKVGLNMHKLTFLCPPQGDFASFNRQKLAKIYKSAQILAFLNKSWQILGVF